MTQAIKRNKRFPSLYQTIFNNFLAILQYHRVFLYTTNWTCITDLPTTTSTLAVTDPSELFAEQMYVSFETTLMGNCFSWLISLPSLTLFPSYQKISGGGFPDTSERITTTLPLGTLIVSLTVAPGGSIT